MNRVEKYKYNYQKKHVVVLKAMYSCYLTMLIVLVGILTGIYFLGV